MELVKYRFQGEAVIIEVTIRGLVAWRYVYNADDRRFVRTSQDSGPSVHTLGLPHELNNDINNWDVQLANLSDANQDYEVAITWKQDGNVLHVWRPEPGSLAPGAVKIEPGSALIAGV